MFANPLNRYHLGDVVYIMPPNPTEIVNNFFELTGFNPDTVIESVVPTDAGKYHDSRIHPEYTTTGRVA